VASPSKPWPPLLTLPGSLIGGVATVLAVIPFAFYRYGEGIRIRSKFAPTDHHKPDDEERQRDTASVGVLSSASEEVIEGEGSDIENPSKEKHDDLQNDIGEPRDMNKSFGKEEE
jgi:MFS transporter, DHA1 family, multidrug resistance protein